MSKPFFSTAAYAAGFVVLGSVNSLFDVFVIEHYPRDLGQVSGFELILLAVLFTGAVSAVLFAAFSALLRSRSSVTTSAILGALNWSLLEGIGKAFGPFTLPHADALLLLTGAPLVAACIARAIIAQRAGAG